MKSKYGLQDVVDFGKYSKKPYHDVTIETIIEMDSKYLRWCIENIKYFELDEEAQDALVKSASYPGNLADEIYGNNGFDNDMRNSFGVDDF